jgi:glutamate synthase domain-containing protein 3
MVGLEPVESEEDTELLRGMVERHLEWTESEQARRVLDGWEEILPRFVKVMPQDLKRVLRERQEAELEVAS